MKTSENKGRERTQERAGDPARLPAHLLPKMLVAGFATVTIVSVIIVDVLLEFL